jgi:hypothetical protein
MVSAQKLLYSQKCHGGNLWTTGNVGMFYEDTHISLLLTHRFWITFYEYSITVLQTTYRGHEDSMPFPKTLNQVGICSSWNSTHKWVTKIFFLIGTVGGGVQLGPLGTATTNGLLYQPWMIMMMEKLVEWFAGETDVLWENLPQFRFVHHKLHMLPGREPGPPRWEPSV